MYHCELCKQKALAKRQLMFDDLIPSLTMLTYLSFPQAWIIDTEKYVSDLRARLK